MLCHGVQNIKVITPHKDLSKQHYVIKGQYGSCQFIRLLHTESNNDLIVSANNAQLRNLKRLQLGTRLI